MKVAKDPFGTIDNANNAEGKGKMNRNLETTLKVCIAPRAETAGLWLLLRLARAKRQFKKLPPLIVPERIRQAALKQGVVIR